MKTDQQPIYSVISLEDISTQKKIPAIENFIVSDRHTDDIRIQLNEPMILEGIALMICIRGKGRLKLNLKELDIQENMIISVLTGSTVEFLERSDDFLVEFLVTSFDFISDLKVSFIPDFIIRLTESPCLKLAEEEINILLEFHAFIVKHYNRTDHLYRADMGKKLLASLLIEIMSIYKTIPEKEILVNTRKEEIARTFFHLVLKYHKEERSVAFYADKMCMTAQHMTNVIKEVSRKSALAWINKMTIVTIKSYLKTSTLTISQISEELNFPNPSFFGRFFKKYTGLTPVQYRMN